MTLKVTDTEGAFSTATVVITVQAPDPGPGPDAGRRSCRSGHGSYVQGTTPSGLIQGVSVSQSAQAGQPARAIITTASGKTDDSRPGATFEMAVHLPAGMARNTSSFATCQPDLAGRRRDPPRCPAGSVIGAGSAVFDAWPVVADFVDAQVTIFNGTGGSMLLYVLPELGPAFVMEGRPVGGSALEFAVPPIHTLPGAPLAALAGLDARPPVVRLPDEPARLPDGRLRLGIRLSLRERRAAVVVAQGPVHEWFADSRDDRLAGLDRFACLPRLACGAWTRRSHLRALPVLRVRTSTSSSYGRR